MSILLYSGTPGSGKSLHAAKTITDWFKKGKPVISNFELDLTRFPKAQHTCVDDDELTPDFLVKFSRSYFEGRKLSKKDEDTILLVIDECQLIFNSRDYQKKDRKIWIKFFSTHRHLGYHVILIAQMDKMLDKQIRGVIEYEYIHRKLSNFGKAGKLLTFFTAGETFTAVQMWYPLKLKIGTTMFRAKKKYYSIYDSYASFGEPKPLPAADQTPAQEDPAAPELLDPEVKEAEIVDLPKKKRLRLPSFRIPKIRKRVRKEKPEKQRKRPGIITGDYFRPYNGRTLVSNTGKYLRPGGRTETGWRQHD